MENFESGLSEEEVILARYLDIEWVDEVRELRCKRCARVLVQHYIANCQHEFCSNCKRVLGTGSDLWRCPLCQEVIRDIERQDFELRRKVFELRVHCPNRKYGCGHACALKELVGHLEKCEDTQERALPALYKGGQLPESERELLELRAEMKEMRQKMMEMENKFLVVDGIVERVQAETKTLSFEIKNKCSLDERAIEMKLMKLEGKMDLWMEMVEKKEMKLQTIETQVQNLRTQIENEVAFRMKLQEMVEKIETRAVEDRTEVEKKLEKVETEVKSVSMEKIEKLEKEIEHQQRLLDMKFNAQQMRTQEMIEEHVSSSNPRLSRGGVHKIKHQPWNDESTETKQRVFQIENWLSLRFPQMTNFDLAYGYGNLQPVYTWKISGVNEITLAQASFSPKSETFSCAGYPFQALAQMWLGTMGEVQFFLNFDDQNRNKAKNAKLKPNCYFVLRDQSTGNQSTGDQSTRDQSTGRVIAVRNDSDFLLKDVHLRHTVAIAFASALTDVQYNVDDSVVIDIYVESPTMAQQVHSYDGTLTWAINQCARRDKMAEERVVVEHQSPYFYTSPRGHRVQVLVYFDGSPLFKNSSLTVVVVFLKSEFGSPAPGSFHYQTTVTLFNRKHPERHIVKQVESNIGEDGYGTAIDVCRKDELASVIENDMIFYKVTIKAATTEQKKGFFF